jgi:hypothetical protein
MDCHLHRQTEIYEREGVDLDRSTIADWVGTTAALLRPLVEAIRQHVRTGPVLHADDAPMKVLGSGSPLRASPFARLQRRQRGSSARWLSRLPS